MRPAPASIPNNDNTMKFKVIFSVDTESENGSSAHCAIIDEDGKEIHRLPEKESMALAYHLSRGASNLLGNMFQEKYQIQ